MAVDLHDHVFLQRIVYANHLKFGVMTNTFATIIKDTCHNFHMQ